MIDELKSFMAVVEEASLTRAAQKLCVTQSTISKRIQRLEEALGAQLFDRDSKPPRPTALAHRVQEHAAPLLLAFERLMHVTSEDGDPTGRLRFGLPQGIADIVLFDALTTMRDAFPDLHVTLRADWSPNLVRLLMASELDVAAVMTPRNAPPLEGHANRYVAALELVVVQSRERPLVPANATFAKITGQEWILNPEGCGYRAALENAVEAAGFSLNVRADTYGSEMQLQLIASGLGLGLVPKPVLEHSAWNQRLEVVNVTRFAPRLNIWLVAPQNLGNLKRAVDYLGDRLVASFESRQSPQ
ncbi:LysR family transcriptional regulator [Paraburkholderia sp. DHOC27]|uniref:LysR family transcriptional regulator n=1 Tax=Paraburkholderia sp. DHOC27 TaxID=2303330 RepID=UPI000E3DBB4B|nr:LysR family transcriptional regulator [Paraburkholderia sp. DHOC27]RFU45469.1 LysR family transcriptional regulator [Paraburkholderia sp. DHOC27]